MKSVLFAAVFFVSCAHAAPDTRETCTTMNICQDDTGGTAVGNISTPEASKEAAVAVIPNLAGTGCLACSVASGDIECLPASCPEIDHVEATHKIGDTFPAGDGCNTCTYISDGAMACTLLYCGKGSITPPSDAPEPIYPDLSSETTDALTVGVASPNYLGTPSLQFSDEYTEELTSKIAKKTAEAVRDICRGSFHPNHPEPTGYPDKGENHGTEAKQTGTEEHDSR